VVVFVVAAALAVVAGYASVLRGGHRQLAAPALKDATAVPAH
jgi:hypothetical protein